MFEKATLKDLLNEVTSRAASWNTCAIGEKHGLQKMTEPEAAEWVNQHIRFTQTNAYDRGCKFATKAYELKLAYEAILREDT